jgi:NADP-dependent 3-hydroxy acid dehydrogenase YdfG
MSQVWLITGSSRGLGRAIVEAGLLAGNKVLATARDIGSLRELSERYGEQVKALRARCDRGVVGSRCGQGCNRCV